MSSTGEALSTLPKPYENVSPLNGSNRSEAKAEGSAQEVYIVEPFNLPVISLPIDTDEDTVPASAKLPGSARPVPTTAPGESDDWAREPVGYTGVRAQLAFFVDEVSHRISYCSIKACPLFPRLRPLLLTRPCHQELATTACTFVSLWLMS